MRRGTIAQPRVVAALVGFLLVGRGVPLYAQTAVRSAGPQLEPQALGALVDLGGYRLHLYCTGPRQPNTPTVVLIPGSGEYAADWMPVQSGVADSQRVCSYDRPGEGWSDPGPMPRTFRQEIAELRLALSREGDDAPYLLVGHALGGLVARAFAAEDPGAVAGLVLVSPTSEDATLEIRGQVVRLRALAKDRPLPPVHTLSEAPPTLGAGPSARACEARAAAARIESPYDLLPGEAQQYHLWSLRHSACLTNTVEDDYLPDDFAAMYARHVAGTDSLGTRSLIVIAGTRKEAAPPGVSAEYWERRRLEGLQQLADVARLSREGRLITDPRAGDHAQLEDPDCVIGAIREVARAAASRP